MSDVAKQTEAEEARVVFTIVLDPLNPETLTTFEISLYRSWSPLGFDRFIELIETGFYNQCRFFRVIKGFVVQFGINGSPEVMAEWRQKAIGDDPVIESNTKRRISFAMSGKNSRTTQVFINLVDNGRLDGMGFSPFGEVTKGMEKVESIFHDYGERPNQGLIQQQGNQYLEEHFPKLSYIVNAELVADHEVKTEEEAIPSKGIVQSNLAPELTQQINSQAFTDNNSNKEKDGNLRWGASIYDITFNQDSPEMFNLFSFFAVLFFVFGLLMIVRKYVVQSQFRYRRLVD